MAGKNTLKEIIRICHRVDRMAHDMYRSFAATSESEEIARYWNDMAEEEAQHVNYWVKLRNLEDEHLLPNVFENEETLKRNLEEIEPKILDLYEKSRNPADLTTRMLISYRLEFYMLDKAFLALMHNLDATNEMESPGDNYEAHLQFFVDAAVKFGIDSPELELMGEMLKKVWYENREIILKSTLDPLTRVLNRTALFQSMQTLAYLANRNNYCVGLAMLDIDNFKEVNDTYGHQHGDSVLKAVAASINGRMRRSDLVGRYGGEEFLVFMPSVQEGSAAGVCEKIRLGIEEDTASIHKVTVSVGAFEGVVTGDVDAAIERIIGIADANLYIAKRKGKNTVVISSDSA